MCGNNVTDRGAHKGILLGDARSKSKYLGLTDRRVVPTLPIPNPPKPGACQYRTALSPCLHIGLGVPIQVKYEEFDLRMLHSVVVFFEDSGRFLEKMPGGVALCSTCQCINALIYW